MDCHRQKAGLSTQPIARTSISGPRAPAVYHPNEAKLSHLQPRTSVAQTGAPPVYRPLPVAPQPPGRLAQPKANRQTTLTPKPRITAPPAYNPSDAAKTAILQRFSSQKIVQAQLVSRVIQRKKIRDLVADLTAAGFVLVSTRGSHHRYQNGATNVNLAYHNPAHNALAYQERDVANAIAAVAPAPAAAAAAPAPAPVAYIGLAAMGIS